MILIQAMTKPWQNNTLPTKAALPPSLAIPTATLAGAPPGAFLNAGASASESPPTVGTKSISNSPKHTTNSLFPLTAQSHISLYKQKEQQKHPPPLIIITKKPSSPCTPITNANLNTTLQKYPAHAQFLSIPYSKLWKLRFRLWHYIASWGTANKSAKWKA